MPVVLWSLILLATFAVGIGAVLWGIGRGIGLSPDTVWPFMALGGIVVAGWIVSVEVRAWKQKR